MNPPYWVFQEFAEARSKASETKNSKTNKTKVCVVFLKGTSFAPKAEMFGFIGVSFAQTALVGRILLIGNTECSDFLKDLYV